MFFMKNYKQTQKVISILFFCISVLFQFGCSDKQPEKTSLANAQKNNDVSMSDGEATDSVKHKFEKIFAQKCVAREVKNAVNKDSDTDRFQEMCNCISKRIAKDLSEVDAEKYLQEHEDTKTLEIKFDDAAYFCVQAKPLPKGPHLFGK